MKSNSTNSIKDEKKSQDFEMLENSDSTCNLSDQRSRKLVVDHESKERANSSEDPIHSEDSDTGILESSVPVLSRNDSNTGIFDNVQAHPSSFMGLLQTLVQNNGAFNLSHTHGEFDCIIQNLVQRDDTYLILECAKDLSERLLMMDNVTADRVIPSSKLTGALVKILSDKNLSCDLEIHLVVCRCLFNLMELHEAFVVEAIHNNAIEAILPHLLEIVYIDLTEQCLQVLETISEEKLAHHRLIENNGVHACLRNLEFLTIHSQKKCLKIISNSTASVKPSHFVNFEAEFATFLNILLTQEDVTMIEQTRQIIFRIINCFQNDSKKIEMLFKTEEVIYRFTEVVFGSFESTHLTKGESQSPIFILRSLTCLASASNSIRDSLLKANLGAKILSTFMKGDEDASMSTFASMSSDEIIEDVLKLIGSFIPFPSRTKKYDFVFTEKLYRENFDEESTHNIPDLCRYMEQVFPILIYLYREAIDPEVQVCVIKELVKIFTLCDKLSVTPLINYRESIDIVSGILYKWNTELAPNLKSANHTSILAACLILECAVHSWDSKHVGLLNRVGVLYNLNDLRDFLSRQCSTLETHFQEHEAVLPLLLHVTSEILQGNRMRLSQRFTYTNYIKILGELRDSFELQSSAMPPVFAKSKENWITFLKLFSSVDYPTRHEIISLRILGPILGFLKCISPSNSVFLQSFLSAVEDYPSSFISFVNCLHEISSNTQVSQTMSRSKKDPTEMRLIEGKRILIKLSGKNLQSMHLSRQELILLVPAIISFATIESLLPLHFNINLVPKPILGSSECRNSDSNPKTSLRTVFYFRDVAISSLTPLYNIIAEADSNSREINNDQLAAIWGKTHEFCYSNESVPVSTPMALEPLRAELCETISLIILKTLQTINEVMLPKYLRFKPDIFRNRIFDQSLLKHIDHVSITRIGDFPDLYVHLIEEFSFLFLLNVKMHFVRSICSGMTRSTSFHVEGQSKQLKQDPQSYELCRLLLNSVGFPQKLKLRVSRNQLFKSALTVLDSYSMDPSILEFQFVDEAGSGLGPTMEFYSLVSSSFSQISFMWGTSEREGLGLFPTPQDMYEPISRARASTLFQKLGNFIARAILDSRQVDFHFNTLFLQAIQNWSRYSHSIMSCESLEFLLDLLHQVDPTLASSLRRLEAYLDSDATEYDKTFGGLSNVCELDDLCLYFVLPGNPNYKLVKNGSFIPVTRKNVREYAALVARTILCNGIELQVQSIQSGFAQLLPSKVLGFFLVSELDALFGHANENWSMDVLKACIEADHGYSCESPAVLNFLSILHEFSKVERRQFLQFLTGSPRLPVGGFSSLHPKLTIVKKYVEQGSTIDGQLPSVMTCANYLKLPDYSLRSLMKLKIIQAMREGSGEFFLS